MNKNSSSVRLISVLVAALIYIAGFVMTPLEGLSVEGFRALCTLLASVVLFISECIPPIITSLLLLPAFTYAGVMSTKEFFASSSSTAVFFTLAGYGIGAALMKTNWATVIMRAILKSAKNDPKRIISAFVLLTAGVSLIVANYAAIITILPLCATVLACLGNPAPGSSKLAKGITMALAWGAMCGGIAMPCSNAINVTLMNLLQAQVGIEVSFVQFSVVGIPCAIIMTAFVAWWLPKYCKPEPLTDDQIANLKENYIDKEVKLNKKDYMFLVIVAVMLVLWVASNWFKVLDTTRVALLGVGLMFLPGIDLLDGKSYMKSIAPLGVVMILCIMPIATAVSSTGAGAWIANVLFGGAASWSMFMMLLMMSLGSMILHMFVPSGNSVAALAGALLFTIAVEAGVPGPAICLIFAMQCGNNFIAAYEGIYSFALGYGHFSFGDIAKAGIPVSILQLILCVGATPLLAGLVM